jgi:transposase
MTGSYRRPFMLMRLNCDRCSWPVKPRYSHEGTEGMLEYVHVVGGFFCCIFRSVTHPALADAGFRGGNLLRIGGINLLRNIQCVHATNISDTVGGTKLVERIEGQVPRLKKILIDHAYQGTFSEIAEQVLEIEVEVAAKPESTKGFIPIAKRWVVERTFAWFNFYRRLAKDYEQNVENSAAWMFWANSWLILERFDRKTKLNF